LKKGYNKEIKIMLFSICLEVLLILAIYVANIFPDLYYLFYNGFYGIILSLIVPIIFLYKNKENLQSLGFKKLYLRQWTVLIWFVIFSIGGQIIPLIVAGKEIQWSLIKISFFPLITTTFFEEFLFRGFIQTRIEKQFGFIIAILISGLLFSAYHIGYPGFRSGDDLLLLFAVGIGFALAFKLSGNNFYVSFLVNLPNAFLTYILKSNQFPILTISSTIAAIITIVLIVIIFIIFINKIKLKNV
jgi:membrane protease YdiL (CAAX protease family)